MIRRAYSHSCPHCGGIKNTVKLPSCQRGDVKALALIGVIALADDDTSPLSVGEGPEDQPLSKAYLNVIKTLFKDGAPDGIDEATTLENVKTFMSGVFEGYGQNFDTVKWNSPDHEKLLHLEKNVYQFSGAKNWQMLRDLTSAIKQDGKILPYREYRTKALAIIGEYQGNWLNTEYNAAIAGAQMASKWVDYSAHPEALLEYRTMEDTHVRPEHAELNGIIRPVNDKFWDTYYPPNGWNCRCTVIRLNDGKETKEKDVPYPEIPKMFATNLAKTGLLFPKGSAYYIGTPANIENANLNIQRNDLTKWAQKNLQGNKYPSAIGDITVNGTGINKFFNQPHKNVFEKNIAVYNLPDILNTAKLFDKSEDTTGKFKQLYYMTTKIAGKKNYIVVRETFQGEKNFYTIQDNNKKEKG